MASNDGKTTVLGIVERKRDGRKSRIKAMVAPIHKRASLLPLINSTVLHGSVLYTDALRSYQGLGAEYMHDFADHILGYARAGVHTNNIENFSSSLKRTLKARKSPCAFSTCKPNVKEQVFRFNALEDIDAS